MKFLIYGFGIWLVFTVFVTVFAVSARSSEVRTLPKWVWVLMCLFIPFAGGLMYLFLGRPLPTLDEFRGRGRGTSTRTIAPDDDPDFLRRLAKRLKNEPKPDEDSDNQKGNDLPNV